VQNCPSNKFYYFIRGGTENVCKSNCDAETGTGKLGNANFYYDFGSFYPTLQRLCVQSCPLKNESSRVCVSSCKDNAAASNNWKLTLLAHPSHVSSAAEEAKIYVNSDNNTCISTCPGDQFTTVQINNSNNSLIDNYCSLNCPMTNHVNAAFTKADHYRLTFTDNGKKMCSDSCPSDKKYIRYTGSAPFVCDDKCSYTPDANSANANKRELDTLVMAETLITFKTGSPKLACVADCSDTSSTDNIFTPSVPIMKLVTLRKDPTTTYRHYKCVDRCNKEGVTVLESQNIDEDADKYWFYDASINRCRVDCPVYTDFTSSGENSCVANCDSRYVQTTTVSWTTQKVYFCKNTCAGKFMFMNDNNHL
jgi:hypothetical protein